MGRLLPTTLPLIKTMNEQERDEQKAIMREVAKEFIDGLYREMGKSVLKTLGVLVVLGVLALSFKLGLVDKLLGF